jgi:hypothetical protein
MTERTIVFEQGGPMKKPLRQLSHSGLDISAYFD